MRLETLKLHETGHGQVIDTVDCPQLEHFTLRELRLVYEQIEKDGFLAEVRHPYAAPGANPSYDEFFIELLNLALRLHVLNYKRMLRRYPSLNKNSDKKES